MLMRLKLHKPYVNSHIRLAKLSAILLSAILGQIVSAHTSPQTDEPPGTKDTIAFWGMTEDQLNDIYTINLDGTDFRNLTAHSDPEVGYGDPAWSPDGSQIAFVSNRDSNPEHKYFEDIFVMNADGSNPVNLTHTPDKKERFPTWSSDGKQINFTIEQQDYSESYVMDADGSNVTQTPMPVNSLAANVVWSDWSPDHTEIAFDSDITGDLELYVMDADGSNVIQLTDMSDPIQFSKFAYPGEIYKQGERDNWLYVWSPDGSKLAFISENSHYMYSRAIYTIDLSNQKLTRVAYTPSIPYRLDWSPDGCKIVFDDYEIGIKIVDGDGENFATLFSWKMLNPVVAGGQLAWKPRPILSTTNHCSS